MPYRKVAGTAVQFSVWETRVSDWKAYLEATGRPWTHWPPFPQTDEHPVVNVTMVEAKLFCDWLTSKEHSSTSLDSSRRYRLPTSQEWDAAVGVRANGSSSEFPWGTEWPPPADAGNYNSAHIEGGHEDGFAFTAPVGKFRPSADGLYDLGGNAWEWTLDSLTGGGAKVSLRGASWLYWRKECLTSSYALPATPEMRFPSIGFRCVLENTTETFQPDQRNLAKQRSRAQELLDRPKLSKEEMASMSKEYAEKNHLGSRPSGARAGHEATPGAAFVNSLGTKMIPLPEQNVLLAEHELRVKDFKPFALQNGAALDQQVEEEPVTMVSWTDAAGFCLWLTRHEHNLGSIPRDAIYRLPKLEEWKTACGKSAASGSIFPWGGSWPPPAGFANLGIPASSAVPGTEVKAVLKSVKSFPPNASGFYDLTGNAAEWCVDVDPNQPGARSYCGGSWHSTTPEDLRNNAVQQASATTGLPEVGFRLVLQFKATSNLPDIETR